MPANHFKPFADLAAALLPFSLPHADDGSHDMGHLIRVFRNACAIQRQEGGDLKLITAAVLLHDCVAFEKNDPRRAHSSRLAAERAAEILNKSGFSGTDVALVSHAIEAHSFSANIAPETLEAKIVQDADRLDAIGFVGIARCFYVAGRLGSKFYDPDDPEAKARPLDDCAFALDHFERKLLKLATGFQTVTGRQMAQKRHSDLVYFRAGFLQEIA